LGQFSDEKGRKKARKREHIGGVHKKWVLGGPKCQILQTIVEPVSKGKKKSRKGGGETPQIVLATRHNGENVFGPGSPTPREKIKEWGVFFIGGFNVARHKQVKKRTLRSTFWGWFHGTFHQTYPPQKGNKKEKSEKSKKSQRGRV